MTDKGRGDFFAISREHFYQACELGLGQAVAYLVIACGTGKSQTRSKWSADAIRRYAGIRHDRGRRFITDLEQAGLMANIGTTKMPLYELVVGDEYVWLPNSIIKPIAKEAPVIFRLRQAKDVGMLRLFVDLYDNQNLGFSDGIDPTIVRGVYEREFITDFKSFNVYTIKQSRLQRCDTSHPLVAQHKGKFWDRFNELREMGLIVCAVNLYDGPVAVEPGLSEDDIDGEYIFTVWGPLPEERNHYHFDTILVDEGTEELRDMLEAEEYTYLAALPRHIAEPEVVGVFRMLHTARTKAASTWWARVNEANRHLYRQIGMEHLIAKC